jgi:hypothetical protein
METGYVMTLDQLSFIVFTAKEHQFSPSLRALFRDWRNYTETTPYSFNCINQTK